MSESHGTVVHVQSRAIDGVQWCIESVVQTTQRPELSEKGLRTPDNCVVAIIDVQPQILLGGGGSPASSQEALGRYTYIYRALSDGDILRDRRREFLD